MDISTLSATDRSIFLAAFQQFRAGDDEEPGEDHSHRDALVTKLCTGEGTLDEVDVHLMKVGVANHIPDDDTFHYLMGLLPGY